MHHHVTVDESVELATMTLNPASSLQSDFDQVTAYKGGKTWSTKKKVTVALLAAIGIGVLVVVILGALNELKVIHLTDTLTGSNSDANGATPESIQGANHTDATSSSTGGGGGVLPPGPFPPVPGGATGSGGASGSGGGGATGATGPAGPPHVLPIPADRVAEVSQYNGRSFEPPQYFTDNIAAEFHSPTTTPPLLGAITHHSARDGPWSSASSWTEGTVPNANAIVQIDHAIVYDVESSVQIRQIKVSGQGKLSWDRSKDTLLWLDTGIAYGVVDMGDYWSPIPESATPGKPRAEVVFWQSAAPLATTNLGFLFFGPTRMNGAVKADRLFLQDQALVGATSISFVPGTVATSNWRVGDTIVVGSTSDYERYNTDPEYTGPTKFWGPRQNGYMMTDLTVTGDEEQSYGYAKSFDEKRVITAISGDTVSFAGGLSYQHDVISETLHSNDPVVMLPVVINLSRSIRFRSAVPSVRQKRAHLMFGFGDNFQIRWIEAKDMGRTELDPTMWLSDGEIGYADAAKTQQISDPTNVKGRYPIHFHALAKGPTFAARQSVLEGASVWGDQVVVPGRGIAHHVGRLAIEHCVVYNVRGSGMFSETGSEIGQWVDNTVMSIRGDGFGHNWGTRHEVWMSHNGHAGIAYENQARAVLLQGNIATCSHIAFLWHHQIAPFLPVTEGVIPPNTEIYANDGFSLRFPNPLVWGGTDAQTKATTSSQLTSWRGIFGGMFGGLIDTYGAAQAQIPDFNDNTVWSSKYAFRVAHRRAEDRADSSPMVARRFHCWGVLEAFNLVNYSHLYSFWDSLWGRNTKVAGSNGAGMGTVSWEFSFGNLCIKNMAGGIIDQGNMWNYNAFPHSIKTVNVDKPISYGMLNGFGTTGPPSAHPAYGMMGPWSSATNYPVLMRPEVIYDITDFPLPYPLEGYGGFGATDAPGMAGTPKPYFWLDPASKTTLSGTDGMNTIAVSGAIVDRVGVRRFEDWQSPESQLQNMHMDTFPGNYHSTPQRLVERNGCFIQAGTWYMRMWFISYDRLDGSYFIPHIDITLTNFDPAFLAANTVDPMATMPNLPLKPEALRVEDIDLTVERVAPRIVTGPALDISENEPLNFLLQANSGIVSWSVTGVDGAKFAVRAGRYLQLVGGGGFDFENPQDAGANNVYNINLVATEPLGGLSTSSAFTITVIDKNEVGVPFWTDPFTRGTPTALKDLADGNPYWVKSPTSPASILTDGSGSFQVDDAVPTYYIGAPLSSGNLYEFSTMINHDGGYFEIQFGLDSIGGVSIEVFNVQNTWYVRTLDGTSQAPITTLLTASETYNYAQVMRMTYDKSSGAVTLYKQGVSIGSGTAPSGLNVRGPYVRSKACNVGLRAYKGFTAKVT